MKKRRLRLYKCALQKLGEPDYIQFLIDPKQRKIIVMKAGESGPASLKVYWKKLKDSSQCCEFYSKELMEKIQFHFFDIDDSRSMRVKGKCFPDQGLLMFDLFHAEAISGEAEATDEQTCAP